MEKFITLTLACILYFGTSLNSGTTYKIWVPPVSDKQATIMSPLQITTNGKTIVVPMVNSEELECMSKNIYFEAAMESTAGKLAVAQVTMNRVNSSRYPNTVCKVITQGRHYKNGFPVKDRCQFSWYCDGKLDVPPTTGSMWKQSQEVAKYVLSTPSLMDITDGATHYHADYISSPRWADPRRKTVEIDTHIFYNKARRAVKKT
ncbi:MAG TPA: cell wall hydrolase [Flavobacteriales bacterium]|jgi:spore germination cell wall hydrolase CwlJ-like protein|nr:cell wall hydrolase [Flavobacteriales bacterium]